MANALGVNNSRVLDVNGGSVTNNGPTRINATRGGSALR